MEAEWVNLLRTPETKGEGETGKKRAAGERRREGTVRVTENTPLGKVGINKSKRSEVQVLRSQVCVLVREKQELSQSVREERDGQGAGLRIEKRLYPFRACGAFYYHVPA